MIVDIPLDAANYGTPVSQVVLERCVKKAAEHHDFDHTLMLAILDVERGNKGMVNRNRDGSWDLGPGQVNTVQFGERWFQKEYPNVTWQELANDVCLNLDVAGRILKLRMNELEPGQSVWNAVGHYHSKTRKHKLVYLQKVMKAHRLRAEKNGWGYRISWQE